ncbi:MAG: hypothetical protein ACREFZ_05175, partial [Acetobacteraceae bacterium]
MSAAAPAIAHRSGSRHFPLAPALGLAALLFLVAPFVALAFATDWRGLHFAPGDLGAVGVSALLSL